MTPGCLMAWMASLTLNSLASLLISPLKSGMMKKETTPRTAMTTPRKMSMACTPAEPEMAAMMPALMRPMTRPVTP